MPAFHEFFAGGGMVRAGLGPGWRCLFANDVDPRKAAAYRAVWGGDELHVGDVATLAEPPPGRADLAWGSFPCQDLSLAGAGAGLDGVRSGAFHAFWRVIDRLDADGRAPRIVAVENVAGALTSRGGADFAAVLASFAARGWRPGPLMIDAALFLPQSRPRLFVVGLRGEPEPALVSAAPVEPFHPAALLRAVARLPDATRRALVWWRLPAPPPRSVALDDLIEDDPADAPWRPQPATDRLLALMAPLHRERVAAAAREKRRRVGCVYRRTRIDDDGRPVQRAEIRFDGMAGCLRTPAGGSSRQTILVVEGASVRSRLLSAREAARLMGLPDGWPLPPSYSDAYRLAGDGVAVPAVEWLARTLLDRLAGAAARAAA